MARVFDPETVTPLRRGHSVQYTTCPHSGRIRDGIGKCVVVGYAGLSDPILTYGA